MTQRMNYFDRQFLRAEDFQTEQTYQLDRRRQHNQGLFRAGVGDGLLVERTAPDRVRVTAGWALDSMGREIVLTGDREDVLIDAASAVEIWIRFGEEPTEPVSYLGASEQRFTRVEEEPEVVVVAAGDGQPADALRLAVIPAGGDPDNDVRLLAGPRPGSVDEASLADGAVTSRVIAAADGTSEQDTGSGSGVKTGHIQARAVTSDKLAEADGASGQDTGSGSGVKTDHLQDDAVTGPKLAAGAVTSRALAEADGTSEQDTGSGSGVKTGHIQARAVTSDKLAEDVIDGLFERTLEQLHEAGVPIGDESVTPNMLADNAVSSRALAEAVPGSTDQDTNSGTGVKTGHLADEAVTEPKLANDAVSARAIRNGVVRRSKLQTELVFDGVVTVPAASGSGTPGVRVVMFERVPDSEHRFYLISIRPASSFVSIHWQHYVRGTIDVHPPVPLQPGRGIRIENPLTFQDVDVRCVAFRLE